MKKIIIILLLVAINIGVNAQETVVQTYKNAIGRKNTYTDKYVFEEPTYSDITFYFGDTYVRVNDQVNSLYRTISDRFDSVDPTYKSIWWKCIDEKNRQCVVSLMIMKDTGSKIIAIIYDKILYAYYIRQND
jgi:hypothetical protein